MNNQERLYGAYRRQLARLNALLLPAEMASASAQKTPSSEPISMRSFCELLMLARTEEQALTYIRENPEAAKELAQKADRIVEMMNAEPENATFAADESNHPFFLLASTLVGQP